jgi:ubiquinone/menaquinone biosynthesis C-methylase UbiE
MADAARYVPALGRDSLTALYDPVVKLMTRERAFKEKLLAQAGLAAGMDVLDLACGTGTLAVWAKQRMPGARVVGIDGDPRMLERARAKARNTGLDIRFDEGMSFSLPYPDGSFDRVLTTLFFHHLGDADKERTIREVARVLRDDGELHVADWGPPSDPLMAAASMTIRVLDGFEPTRANFKGELPRLFERGGLGRVSKTHQFRTVTGTLALYAVAR